MSRPPLRIAIVDDEESVRKALQRLLRSFAMEAHVFASGRGFLAAVAELKPDGVLLDLHMPELSGFEVLDRLPPHLPAVVITGHDSPEAQARTRRAAAYLRKPVDGKLLETAIRAAVSAAQDFLTSQDPTKHPTS